ncbi:T9SS type A sorting domain-containing protein [Flavobacterium subsaxonicum]|uniref:Secretion system C-terminal sorting domain-containing protein n=1 Tax=Flavobacterium subsaxonicum WB 4.1-42 = DSM 21790 TaxID=1121898 RepID=A0A0A2MP76_9FLAO|nr:T9SS type A sorting domain-containing protein [Flavobacterium subsaxonicum]KGO94109.1 hypothetical protein Q766_04025 [Flavobacterium subsaxonicum WB 4.1-42 = DSM 21790]
MKKLLLLLFLITIGYTATAQVTLIPDAIFEEGLINLNIDTDGIVNGQVLTSDVVAVTNLDLNWAGISTYMIQSLTGIEDFASLEMLAINYSELSSLNVSQNSQLKVLECYGNMLTSINLSQNPLLEELYIGNGTDLGFINEIAEIDLSNNPSIRIIVATNIGELSKVNLKNGNNNANITLYLGFDFDSPPISNEILNTVCVQVDDEELAQNNQFPYSEWEIYDFLTQINFSENCVLGTSKFNKGNTITVYPNPASDVLHINNKTGVAIEKAVLFDISGRVVRQYEGVSAERLSVNGLEKGMYLLTMFQGKTTQTQKVIIE